MKHPLHLYLIELYPQAEYATHGRDPRTDQRISQKEGVVLVGADRDGNGGYWLEWLDKRVPVPTARDIMSEVPQLDLVIDTNIARAARLKSFRSTWTPEKLAEAILDDTVREQLRAEKEAL